MKSHRWLFIFGAVVSTLFFMAAEGYSFTCPNPPVKLGSNGLFYNTIMLAYGTAVEGDIIMLEANPYEEDLDFNSGKTIILDGGYNDCSFLNNSLVTEIAGSLTISGGTVIVSNIVLSTPVVADADGDGYTALGSCTGSGDDCNDNNASIYPYGEIYGDGINQDCIAGDVTATEQTCINCHGLESVNGINANPFFNYHVSVSAPDGTCVDCHAGQVNGFLPGHYGQTVRTTDNNVAAGTAIGCKSCHDQAPPFSEEHVFGSNVVTAKIAADYPNVTCNTCHDISAGDHDHATDSAHDNRTIDGSCGQCHGPLASQADVDTLHRNDCALCHAYTGTKICAETVRQVIEDGLNGTSVSCLDCHTAHHSPETNQVSYNPLVDTSQPSQDGCAVCHMDYDLAYETSLGLSTWETILVEHDLDGTKDGSSSACGTCHTSPRQDVQDVIDSGNPATCANCHTDKVPDVTHGTPTSGKHTSHLDMAGINKDCIICHTSAPYFQSGTDTNGDGKYDLAETDVCNPCHQDWDPAGLPAEQDYKAGWGDAGFTLTCNDCHGEIVDNGDNIPAGGRRAVTGEFPASSHAHYGALLDSASCQVCHDYTNHADGTVNLLDPDGGSGYNFVYAADLTTDPDLSNFCANCHDADGATRLVPPLDPMNPFANGNVPPDVATRFLGTLQWREWHGDGCFGWEGSGRPVNSHHDISDADQAFSGAKIECINCHGAHTSAASQKVTDPYDSNVAWTGTLNEFCLECHFGGAGPSDPDFPTDVVGPTFTANGSCGTDQFGNDMVYDCTNYCVTQTSVDTNLGNGTCDNNLNCSSFNYDNGDCAPVTEQTPCIGNDCSTIGGIDTCSYDFSPWWVEISWANEHHGGGSKRQWTGYSGAPTVPEMDCVACHDSHGSYNAAINPVTQEPFNLSGNPYMIRDYVYGSQFLDDKSRPQGNPQPWIQGTDGPVVITISPSGPSGENGQLDGMVFGNQFCIKCHATWEAAYSWHSYGCTNCLTCHAHGAAWGGQDWGPAPDDSPYCP